MKIDIKNYLYHFFQFFVYFGLFIFLLLFWFPKGFFLGGDPNFFGPYLKELEIIFPFAGIGILIIFFSQFFSNTQKKLSYLHLTFLLLFLFFLSICGYFSLEPKKSLLFIILWAISILAFSFGDVFSIFGKNKRNIFFLGILAGYFCEKYFFNFSNLSDILGASAILAVVFLAQEEKFFYKIFYLFFYVWVISETQNFWLILLALIIFLSEKLWLTKRNANKIPLLILPILFLLILSFWGIWNQKILIENIFYIDENIFGFFDSLKNIFFGIGQGEYLIVLQKFSKEFLIPQKLLLPKSGIILTFFELGILGIINIFLFIFSFYFFTSKKNLFFPLFFLSLWCISPDFFSTPNGILFSAVFLSVDF